MKLPDEEGIHAKLRWMMVLRVLVVTLFLGSYLFVFTVPTFSILIAVTYLATIVYALLFRLLSPSASAYLQTGGDLLLITVLIGMTGGVESPFVFLYLISIMAAAILLSRTGAFVTASQAGILYGLTVDVQYFGFFSVLSFSGLSGEEVFYRLFLNIGAFFAVAYVGSSLSVSLKRMREELREKASDIGELQAFNENVARSMSSGLLTTDMAGRVALFNRAAEEITGYTFEEVQGKLWMDLFPLREIREIFAAEAPTQSRWRFDGDIVRKDGGHRIVGVTVSLLRDETGENKGVIGIFQDLTQIKEMEAEVKKREKMAMVGELAAGMAHEIRNPLASLSGAMQMLRKELNLEGENGRLMEIALRETERLNIKITEFLAYARPSPPRKKPCDLNGLLHDTLDLLKNSEEYREGITLWTETDGALWVDVDANQISQVFWNLAINALQAMPGMGELRVSSRSYRILGEEVEIIFFDSGQGIEPDLLDKIFVPFFTTKERGSGLGLSIVHRIVEDHGGRIRVRSRPGDGTEFRVCLPVTSEG